MWTWIVIALVVIAIGLVVLASARRKGPNVEGAFVDTEEAAADTAAELRDDVVLETERPGDVMAEVQHEVNEERRDT